MAVLELALLLLAAFALGRVAERVGLPALLGMIAAGVVFRALPLPTVLPGPALLDLSSTVRIGILDLVLLRAGLGLTLGDIRSAGGLGIRLGVFGMLGDAALLTVGAVWLLGLPFDQALVLGFLVAAISPAIVIPSLLELLERHKGGSRRALTALLVGAPLDNIVALVAFGIALDLAGSGDTTVGAALLAIPWKIAAAVLAGVVMGSLLALVPRCPTFLLWLAAVALTVLGKDFQLPWVLSVIALGATVRARAPQLATAQGDRLKWAWTGAQYVLFGLIGAAVELEPLAGIGVLAAAVILMGQGGRMLGSALATLGSGLSRRARLACALCFVPKATLQAAFAALPMDQGLSAGGAILSTAVLAIVMTAPLGTLAIFRGADPLLLDDAQVTDASDGATDHG